MRGPFRRKEPHALSCPESQPLPDENLAHDDNLRQNGHALPSVLAARHPEDPDRKASFVTDGIR